MLRNTESEPPQLSVLNVPAEPKSADAQIDTYLDRVSGECAEQLPDVQTIAVRREMRLHLEELIAANVELGSTAEEAIGLAIRQFGSARIVGGRWRTLCEEAEIPAASHRSAFPIALGWFSITGAMIATAAILSISNVCRGNSSAPYEIQIIEASAFLLPFMAGLVTGKCARLRPIRSAFLAQCIVTPLIGPICDALAWYINLHQRCPLVPGPVSTALTGCILMTIVTAPAGCLGALIGSRLRRRGARKLCIAS